MTDKQRLEAVHLRFAGERLALPASAASLRRRLRARGSGSAGSGGSSDAGDDVASPVDFVEVPGDAAEDVLAGLERGYPERAAVLLGSPLDAARLFEWGRHGDPAERTLELAASLDIDAWIGRRAADARRRSLVGHPSPPRGPWPATASPRRTLEVLVDLDCDAPHDTVVIALIETTAAADAIAWLGFGAYGNCPRPAVHVALARKWAKSHGAAIIAVSHDTVEMRIARPVASRGEALRTALEHFLYCPDSVTDTLEDTAADLIGATVWSFWWARGPARPGH